MNPRRDPMLAKENPSVLFVLPPGGVTPYFAEHLGTAFLRAMLAGSGVASAQYLPPRNPSLAGFARELRERRPAVVGFTAYESNLRACRAMARAVRETLPEAVVAVGGPNATFSPEETLELLGADLCLRGAGEGMIVRIVQAILGSDSPRGRLPDLLAEVPNLVIRTAEGPHHTRAGDLSSFPGEHFRCLDDLPSPYQAGLLSTADVGILTARGCNQHCTYCSFAAISGRKIHYHGVERVLEDLAALKPLVERTERRRPTISINDDAFTLAPHRAREICEGIIARGLQMPFECETRADRVDADLLRLMKRAGFTSVAFGLESAVPHVLRAIGKVRDPAARGDPGFEAERAYVESVRSAISAAKAAGLSPTVSVIGGLPAESADDFRATLAFVESLELPVYAHNILSVLPGTPLHRDRKLHGLEAQREAPLGVWRTRHAYDVTSVTPPRNSTTHLALWEEANELADAICGRPRPTRAADAAWAVVLHGEPDENVARWLPDVLAMSGAVIVSPGRKPGHAGETAWLQALAGAEVPWSTFAVLSPEEDAGSGVVLCSGGTQGRHRFEIHEAWPVDGRQVQADDAGNCRAPVWFASASTSPPPIKGAGVFAPAPQVADGCRWWSSWPRCGQPPVLHVRPDGTVSACWSGPPLGRVGDGYRALADRGRALGARAGRGSRARPGRCPLQGKGETETSVSAAAETWEIAARSTWLFGRSQARHSRGDAHE